MKYNGHTHTELCPHGSGQSTAAMIEKAIELGFTDYCITEHAPLPIELLDNYVGPLAGFCESALRLEQVEDYFSLAEGLREQFSGRINIHIGFEVDYLPGLERQTRALLDRYGPRCDTGILSVHFLTDEQGRLHCGDATPELLAACVAPWLDDPQEIYHRYLTLVKQSVEAELGAYAPKRIGHMSLIKRHQDYFHFPEQFDARNMELVREILLAIRARGGELDFNLAGMYKPECNEFYPGMQIAALAAELGVPMVYGSDSHEIDSIGRGYHLYTGLMRFFGVKGF